MKKSSLALALAVLMLLGCVALADGVNRTWVQTSSGESLALASFVGDYDGWTDTDGLGGVTPGETASVRVISRNASVWDQPRTNSGKLGTVKNGQEIACVTDAYGNCVMQDGFYAVSYQGRQAWINSAYAVTSSLEIVLMESNVPAYCAPSRNAKRVGSLAKLTRYAVLGFYDDFYVVSLREAAAFIPMSVKHYDSTYESYFRGGWHGEGTVTSKTTVRTGPGSGYASVRDMKAGASFTYMGVIDGWCILQDSDSGCFVYINADDTNVVG